MKICDDHKGSFLYWLKDKNFIKYIYLDDIKPYFEGKENWLKNFLLTINKYQADPYKDSKYKYLLGSPLWMDKIRLKIKGQINKEITEHNKYFEFNINKNILENELSLIKKNERIGLEVYIYTKYSALTAKEIAEKLKLDSEYAVSQRLYRLKKKINENKEMQENITKFENKVLKR